MLAIILIILLNLGLLDVAVGRHSLSGVAPRHRKHTHAEKAIIEINVVDPTAGLGKSSSSHGAGQMLSLTIDNSSEMLDTSSAVILFGGPAVQDGGPPDVGTTTSSHSPSATTGVATTGVATTGVATTGVTVTGDEQSAWVNAHNSARSQYGADGLTWDDALSAKAASNAKLCSHTHSNAGENIAWLSPGLLTPQGVVDMWMSEAPLYDWSNPHYDDSWGHFTQCIWANTQRVGCYVAQCGTGSQATCEYDPAGNYVESFNVNVKPKGSPMT